MSVGMVSFPEKKGAPVTMIRNASMWLIIASAMMILAGASLL
jgi:hypothetical protein